VLVGYDPRERASANAEQIAAELELLLAAEAVSNDWVRKIWLHLVGFSAGGIVAVQTASRLRCEPRLARPLRSWCGVPLEPVVPVEMDVVTMATPFDFPWYVSALATIGTALANALGLAVTFEWSIATNDYGGDRPSCLCSFTAFISSDDYDDSSGADSPPDDRLDSWNAKEIDVPEAPGLTHVGVPAKVLAGHPGKLDGRCACV
jgi:pimeloyl-ACP methyl ester carboxylesterase